MPQLKFTTAAAARFCAANGRPISYRTLQKYRLRGLQDPGEPGPRFLRDPLTSVTYYLETDLLSWCRELEERLVERGVASQPSQLSRDAA